MTAVSREKRRPPVTAERDVRVNILSERRLRALVIPAVTAKVSHCLLLLFFETPCVGRREHWDVQKSVCERECCRAKRCVCVVCCPRTKKNVELKRETDRFELIDIDRRGLGLDWAVTIDGRPQHTRYSITTTARGVTRTAAWPHFVQKPGFGHILCVFSARAGSATARCCPRLAGA